MFDGNGFDREYQLRNRLLDGRIISGLLLGYGLTLGRFKDQSFQHFRIFASRGAVAALYGSSAMGRVINIITRKSIQPLSYQLTLDGSGYADNNLQDRAELSVRDMAANAICKSR